jgi:hypothetical protein
LSLTFGINRRIRPWHFGNRPKLSRGNDLAKAMDYMLKEHCRSTRYLGRASLKQFTQSLRQSTTPLINKLLVETKKMAVMAVES